MKHSNIGLCVIGVCVFSTGYLSGAFLQLESIEVDNKIDVLSAISIFCSIILVVYVSILFDKAKEGSRLKKEIVLKKCDELCSNISSFERTLSGNSAFGVVASELKRISLQSGQLNEFIHKAEFKNDSFIGSFLIKYNELRIATSLTPPDPTVVDPNIRAVHGKFEYSQNRLSQISLGISALNSIVIEEQLRIAIL